MGFRAAKSSGSSQVALTQPVFLIGFMGAGKSSVARRLARSCGVAALDLDTYIERQEGMSVAQIFAQWGEEGFRRKETEALRMFAEERDPMLVSCGGGVVVTDENLRILRERGYVVHLKVDADEAASRISDTSSRPLFSDLAAARLRCEERMPVYEQVADITIDTAGREIYEIARDVRRVLEKEGILCRPQK